MSINSMKNTMCYKTQCYKITKKDGRYHLFDKDYEGNNLSELLIPIKDWKQMRGLYEYLEKQHKANYTMKEIQKIVKTSSNGVFLLDNDESEDEEQVKKSVTKNEELLKIENAELKNEIDKLNKIIIQTNQINTDLKQQIILLSPIEEVEQEKEVEEEEEIEFNELSDDMPIINKEHDETTPLLFSYHTPMYSQITTQQIELLIDKKIEDNNNDDKNNIKIVAKDFVNNIIKNGVNKIKNNKKDKYDDMKKQIENKQQELKISNMKKYLPNNEDVVKIKFINSLDSEELVLLKTKDYLLLHPLTYEKYGYYGDWVDEHDEIPEELKNEDNIVLDPDTGFELIQYTIEGGCEFINGKYNENSYEYDSDIDRDGLRDSDRQVEDLFDGD